MPRLHLLQGDDGNLQVSGLYLLRGIGHVLQDGRSRWFEVPVRHPVRLQHRLCLPRLQVLYADEEVLPSGRNLVAKRQ